MKNTLYLIIAILIIATASCKKDDIIHYHDVNRIQFGPDQNMLYSTYYHLMDTSKAFTFFYSNDNIIDSTVYFNIYSVGGVSNIDRAYTIEQEQIAGADNAVAGKDYKAFNDPSLKNAYIIKAGSSHALVPIVVLRNGIQKTKTLILSLKIVANENFQLGQKECLKRSLYITDRVNKPTSWNDRYFGSYSVVKHSFMIRNTGQKWDYQFCLNLPYRQGDLFYYLGRLKMALADYNNANTGNPLRDENGSLIVFP